MLEGNEHGFLIDDEDIYIGYRRPGIVHNVKIYNLDDDIPEYIKWRLFLARQLALLRYKELHG